MKYTLKILYCFLFMWVGVTFADTTSNLNTVQLPIADHSATALQQAFNQGFDAVMTQLTGNPEVMSLPDISPAKKKMLNGMCNLIVMLT